MAFSKRSDRCRGERGHAHDPHKSSINKLTHRYSRLGENRNACGLGLAGKKGLVSPAQNNAPAFGTT